MGKVQPSCGVIATLLTLGLCVSPSSAQNTKEVHGGERLALGSWAMTAPVWSVYACASPADLARFEAVIDHNVASWPNGSLLPMPKGCTQINAGTEVQLMAASGNDVCVRQYNQWPTDCLWVKRFSIESKAAYNRERQEPKPKLRLIQ